MDIYEKLTNKKRFGTWQKQQIESGIKEGLTFEQISVYAQSGFSAVQMAQIRANYTLNIPMEQVSLYADRRFNPRQMEEIAKGLTITDKENISDYVKLYADPNFTWEQMKALRLTLKNAISLDEFKIIAKPDFSAEQIKIISKGFFANLPKEAIEFCADPKLHPTVMRQVLDSILCGCEIDRLKSYLSLNCDFYQFREIFIGCREGLTDEQIRLYARPEFTLNQMSEIRNAIEDKLSKDQILLFAKPEISWFQMSLCKSCIKNNVPMNKIQLILDPNYDDTQAGMVYEGVMMGFSIEQIQKYTNPKLSIIEMQKIKSNLETEMICKNLQIDDASIFNEQQWDVLRNCLKNRFTTDQIKICANPELDCDKMNEIRHAIIKGFTKEQLKIMSDPKISLSNMKTIALGFYAGITIEQMDYYLKNPNAKRILSEIFEDIEKYHFTEKDIQPYIERKTTKEQRKAYRFFVQTGCSHPERYFDADQHFKQFNITDKQKEILIKHAVNGVDFKKLDVFVGKNFTEEQIDFIISAANKEVKSNTKKEKAWEPLK